MRDFISAVRWWGFSLIALGLIFTIVNLGFWASLGIILVASGNNMEQRAKLLEDIEDGKL